MSRCPFSEDGEHWETTINGRDPFTGVVIIETRCMHCGKLLNSIDFDPKDSK